MNHRALRVLSPWIVVGLLAGLVGCNVDPAYDAEALISIGVADASLGGERVGPFDEQTGGGLAVESSFAPIPDNLPQLRIGARFQGTFYREEFEDRYAYGDPFVEIEDFEELSVYGLEFILGFRQVFGPDAYEQTGFFLEPGVGVGVVGATLRFGEALEFGDNLIAEDLEETRTEAGFSARPYLRTGYRFERFLLGLEGSYRFATFEFDDELGEDLEELYVGFFFGGRF